MGQRLQAARKRRGLTQEEAASAIGPACTTMVAIEKGERRIRANELLQLAQVYGQSVNDLLRDRPQLAPFAPQFRNQRFQWTEATTVFDARIAEIETLCQNTWSCSNSTARRWYGTADKLKADRNRIRNRQPKLGLSPIPGNSDRAGCALQRCGCKRCGRQVGRQCPDWSDAQLVRIRTLHPEEVGNLERRILST